MQERNHAVNVSPCVQLYCLHGKIIMVLVMMREVSIS